MLLSTQILLNTLDKNYTMMPLAHFYASTTIIFFSYSKLFLLIPLSKILSNFLRLDYESNIKILGNYKLLLKSYPLCKHLNHLNYVSPIYTKQLAYQVMNLMVPSTWDKYHFTSCLNDFNGRML